MFLKNQSSIFSDERRIYSIFYRPREDRKHIATVWAMMNLPLSIMKDNLHHILVQEKSTSELSCQSLQTTTLSPEYVHFCCIFIDRLRCIFRIYFTILSLFWYLILIISGFHSSTNSHRLCRKRNRTYNWCFDSYALENDHIFTRGGRRSHVYKLRWCTIWN